MGKKEIPQQIQVMAPYHTSEVNRFLTLVILFGTLPLLKKKQ